MKTKLEILNQVGGRLVKESRRLYFVALIAGVLAVSTGNATASASASSDAAKFVASVGEEVVSVLAAPGVDKDEKRHHFRDIFTHALDLDRMARRVLGRHWRRASDEQKNDYVRLFRDYIVRIYTVQLSGYAGERFAVLRQQRSSEAESVVTARMLREFGPPLNISFRVRLTAQGHRIVDVTIEGVSLIVTKRSEFSAVIRRAGLPGLIRLLDEKLTAEAPRRDTIKSLIAKAFGRQVSAIVSGTLATIQGNGGKPILR